MATFLDVTALQHFTSVFVFIFVWLIVYAVMTYTKVLGNNQLVAIISGFVLGIFIILSDLATLIVRQLAPIFVLILVFFVIVNVATRSFGGELSPALRHITIFLVVGVLILGAFVIIRNNIDVPDTGEDFDETSTIIFHPNMLGLALIFLVAVFAIAFLTTKGA